MISLCFTVYLQIFQYGSCWAGSVQNGGKQFSLFPISSHFSYPLSGKLKAITCDLSCMKYTNPCTYCVYKFELQCNMLVKHLVTGCFEVIIQLESSGKWPNDVTAIRSMETLFYLAIHRDLSKQYKLVSVPTERFIDIFKVSV